MKTTVLLIFLSICFTSNSSIDNESINRRIDSTLQILEERKSEKDTLNQALHVSNQELNKQLVQYKAKEDYFASALEEQSTRFALIVSAILGLLGLISFTWYRLEKQKIRKEIRDVKSDFEELKKDSIRIEADLLSTSADAYSNVALIGKKDGALSFSFEFEIRAALNKYQSAKLRGYQKSSATVALLKSALKTLRLLSSVNEEKPYVLNCKADVIENLNVINKTDDQEIIDLIAEIRILLNEFKTE